MITVMNIMCIYFCDLFVENFIQMLKSILEVRSKIIEYDFHKKYIFLYIKSSNFHNI